jgi:RHS repeat-associated protein
MKAQLVALLLLSVVAAAASAECGPGVPNSSVYGYPGAAGRCKTLEEAEAQMHASIAPTMEYAFWIPSNFSIAGVAGGSLDYRPYGALSTSSAVLQQPATTVSAAYKLYTKGWPPTNVHSNCTAVAAACPGGLCDSIGALSAFVKCQFDNTWNLNATSARPAFCWTRQGEPVTTDVFGIPSVVGTGGTTGALAYTPPSSTASTWGAKISITAQTCDGGPAVVDSSKIDTDNTALLAVTNHEWNIDKREDMTCPAGTTVGGGASSTANACDAPFFKFLINPPKFTQTPGACSGEGNPCFPSNGNKQVDETGFNYGEIAFNLHYNSMRQTRPFSYIDRNWSHTFAKRILTEWAAPGHMSSAETLPIAQVTAVYVQNERSELEVFSHRAPLTGAFQSTDSVGFLLNYIAAVGATPPRWELSRGNGVREIYDRAGRLVQIIDPDPVKTLTLSYVLNELTPGVAPNGNGNHITEVFWRIDRVTDGSGRYVRFEYSGHPFYWLSRIVSNTGANLLTLDYDGAHRLTSLQFADTSTRQYLYNEPANIFVGGMVPAGIIGYWLTGILDERGQRYATYRYDDWGRAVSSWHGIDHGRVDVSYVNDQSAIVTYALGNTKTIVYNTSEPYRHKQSETDLSGTRQYQYDPVSHRLTQIQDALGNITKLQYDSNSARVTRRIEAFGTAEQRRIETDWDTVSSQMLARRVYRDPGNTGVGVPEEQFAYTYDPASRNLLTRTQTDPITSNIRRSTYTYCSATDVANGATTGCAFVAQLRQEDGPRTDVVDTTTYTYRLANDAGCASNGVCNYRKGDLWKRSNALAQVTEYVSHDSAGRVTRMKDANGVLTDMTYHARGWLQTRTVRADPTGAANVGDAITTLSYDDAGQITRIAGPDGVFLDYTYDAAQRLKRITDNLGNRIDYTLDALGNRITEETRDLSDALTHTLGRVYDSLGRLHKLLNAQNAETVFTYDANGNQDTVTDALLRIADSDVDPLDRLIQSTDALLGSTEYRYDARDQLTEVIDAKNLSTRYVYNGLSDLMQLESPDTGTSNFTYDSAGNRKTQTDARGVLSTHSYDALNRLTSIAYPTTTNHVSFSYDQNHAECPTAPSSERFGIGRLTGFTDPSGSTKLCYDRRGNVLRKISVVNGTALTTRWAYNIGDRVTQLVYPSGTIANYTRDTQGRVGAIGVTPAGGSAQVLVGAVSYYPFGPVRQITWGNNGPTSQRIYDQNYWIDSIDSSQPQGLDLDFSLDPLGNITGLIDTSGGILADNLYTYDELYRLTSFDAGGSYQEDYTYDAIGNRLSIRPPHAAPIPYVYGDKSHHLLAVGGLEREYDKNGNTTTRDSGSRSAPYFVYDERNRLSAQNWQAGNTLYQHNARGERVFKNVNNLSVASRSFAYGPSGNLLMEGNANGTAIQEFIWLDNLPVGVVAGGQLLHIQPDHLGTPRKVVQSNNTVVWDWPILNNPFGEAAPNQDPDANGIPFTLNLRFPGQYYDAETGLHYNYFRDYEPGTGRYVESDPIGLGDDFATYSYVGGSPLMWADTYGLAKGGRQNVSTEGFNKKSDPKEVERALKEAIKDRNMKRAAKLRGLLKIIKRGGSMGFGLFPLQDYLKYLCQHGDTNACIGYCKLYPEDCIIEDDLCA